ncbi:MAG TPA: hypothetical protein ENK57_01850 [Polyangiaceae bacterium]|nr:hypothetical protein [Polyangiaceae bacterium]
MKRRGLAITIAAVVAMAIFLVVVHEHYPLQHWLVWRYLLAWLWGLGFVLSCAGLGARLAGPLLDEAPPGLRERLVLELAVGVVGFFTLLVVGGLAGVFGPVLSVVVMAFGIGVGLPVFRPRARRVFWHGRALIARHGRPRPWWHAVGVAAAGVGIGLIYFSILSPNNAAFDARFYHLAIAEQYAITGAIRPPPEVWWPAALPQLASVLYGWVFTLPGLGMFNRIVYAAHLEFLLFVATLASLGVLVRRIVPGSRAPLAWASLLLFPGIFLYDSALSLAADHVTAFFAVPIFLALLRIWRRPTWRSGVLFGVVAAGAVLTKYQALYLLVGPAVALLARVIVRGASFRPGRRLDPTAMATLVATGAAAGAGLLVTAPHWLKNWVFYGNPLFPNLLTRFDVARYPEGTAHVYDVWRHWQTHSWVPQGSAADKARETMEVLFTFSFSPHDWEPFHGDHPVFGSLFTLSLLIVPFLTKTRRLWALMGACYLGLALWFLTLHQDRYLQILLPWMAAVVAATVVLAWREGLVARLGVTALLVLQVIWGGDVYFIPAHVVTHQTPAVTTSKLLAAGYRGEYRKRFVLSGLLYDLGRHPELPPTATVLLHEQQERFGTWRRVVTDLPGYQFGIRYELEPSPAGVYDRLVALGVTHILVPPRISHGNDALGPDLRFFDFIHNDTIAAFYVDDDYAVHAIPSVRPPEHRATRVAYLGCEPIYERGLHELRNMDVREFQFEEVSAPRPADVPLGDASIEALVAEADFVVTSAGEDCPVDQLALQPFSLVAMRVGERLWARTRPRAHRRLGKTVQE